MAMTNAERQAKWKAKLRAQAAGAVSFEAALRDKLKSLFPGDWSEWGFEGGDSTDMAKEAAAAMLAMTDQELEEWMLDSIGDLHSKKYREISSERQRQAKIEAKKAAAEAKRTAKKNDREIQRPLLTDE